VDTFPLTTLLALRRREEEAAESGWAATVTALRAAEARLAALAGLSEQARLRLDQARLEGHAADAPLAATEVATRQRFLARRRDEWKAALAAEAAFRDGPLAAARDAEASARQLHANKRRDRELVEKQQELWQLEVRRRSERRAEDARDDLTAAARHRRERDP
jgi:hypothetical protein